jgi:hypothetical protein
MKPNPSSAAHHAGLALTFFAMAAAGWIVGGGPSPEPGDAAVDAPPERAARVPVRDSSRYGVPVSAKSQVAAIKSLRTPEERMRATIHLANTLSPRQLHDWLEGRWFEMGSGYDLSLFNKIARERLRTEDPRLFLKWALGEESDAGSVMADVAAADPDYVLECIAETPLTSRLSEMLRNLARSHPALALRAFQELRGKADPNGPGDHYRRQILSALAEHSPQTLAAAMDSLDPEDRRHVEVVFLREKLSGSFESEIRKLWERPDGWTLFRESYPGNQDLGNKLLAELGNLPPEWRGRLAQEHHGFINRENAREWWDVDYRKLGFSKEQELRIRSSVALQIGQREPEEAMRLLGSLDLPENQRTNVLRNLILNQRHQDPERAESLLAHLPTEKERDEVRSMFSRMGGGDTASVPNSPAEWLREVTTGGVVVSDLGRYTSALRQWDQEKLGQLAAEFRSLPAETKGAVAGALMNNVPDRALRGEAISYLVANPPAEGQPGNSNVTSRAATFAAEWGRSDPQGATQWVQSLPAGESRLWAQKNLALAWSEYEPEEAGRWMSRLPAEERKQVEEFVKSPGFR